MTEQEINASWDKARDWTKKDWEQFKQEGDDMHHAFVDALSFFGRGERGSVPSDLPSVYVGAVL